MVFRISKFWKLGYNGAFLTSKVPIRCLRCKATVTSTSIRNFFHGEMLNCHCRLSPAHLSVLKYLRTLWPYGVTSEQPLRTSCGRCLFCDIVLLDGKGLWCAVVEVDGKDHKCKGASRKPHRLRDGLDHAPHPPG